MKLHTGRPVSRRAFLRGMAAVSVSGVAAGASVPAARAEEATANPPHGAELRGMSLPVKDPYAEGRFGFMFKGQPGLAADELLLTDLGQRMREQPRLNSDPAIGPVVTPDDNDRPNENPNAGLTSGFTFLGQFIDHDITFDTTTLDLARADPDAIVNFRTPRYDLDAVYGRGPDADPQLYGPQDRAKLLVTSRADAFTFAAGGVTFTNQVTVEDVPRRDDGAALVADRRNDQTLIITQLHVAFLKFHNRLVDHVRALGVPAASAFESARRLARWHYQWLVIHDFLPRIADPAVVNAVYKEVAGKPPVITLKYYRPTNRDNRAFIPVEFSVAAYRFGHSLARPRYTVRDVFANPDRTGAVVGSIRLVPLFEAAPSDNNLNGSRPIPARLTMQWSKFFSAPGTATARPARRIDARLSDPLFSLPATAIPDTNPTSLLAVRNLLRGRKLNLPSGQRLAALVGAPALTNADLAQKLKIDTAGKTVLDASGKPVREPDPEFGGVLANAGWGGQAPAWFYVLKEAELLGKAERLGPLGSRITAEVLVGLLQRDPNSYLYLNAAWKPQPPIAPAVGQFTMVDLLRYAGVWS